MLTRTAPLHPGDFEVVLSARVSIIVIIDVFVVLDAVGRFSGRQRHVEQTSDNEDGGRRRAFQMVVGGSGGGAQTTAAQLADRRVVDRWVRVAGRPDVADAALGNTMTGRRRTDVDRFGSYTSF